MFHLFYFMFHLFYRWHPWVRPPGSLPGPPCPVVSLIISLIFDGWRRSDAETPEATCVPHDKPSVVIPGSVPRERCLRRVHPRTFEGASPIGFPYFTSCFTCFTGGIPGAVPRAAPSGPLLLNVWKGSAHDFHLFYSVFYLLYGGRACSGPRARAPGTPTVKQVKHEVREVFTVALPEAVPWGAPPGPCPRSFDWSVPMS